MVIYLLKKMNFYVKKFLQRTTLVQKALLVNFTQMFKEDNNLMKTSPESLKKKILSNSFHETSFTQIKNQTETIQTKNYRLIFFIYIDAKEFLTKFEQFESKSKLQVALLLFFSGMQGRFHI